MATQRVRIQVEGIVQGVGFRPFVHREATSRGLAGFVRNDERGARIEVEGASDAVGEFADGLAQRCPALARIDRIERHAIPITSETGFRIETSEASGERHAPISPDIATCRACLAEIFDPADRRHRYAFTNCTACGPRYSIVRSVPYDRPATTMSGFAMCDACTREYDDPGDRRFHAQPVCCPACGPRLRLIGRDGKPEPGDPIERSASLLGGGAVVAIKGLGGVHLAVCADDEAAVATLRRRKRREERPLAVMAPDLAWAGRLVELDAAGAHCLASPEHPILLAERRADAPVAPSVAPETRLLGVMLPYTPLHHLLGAALGRPWILTSGNLSDEPIAYRDDDARDRLAPLCDFWLTHDRPIHMRCDDSVARVARGRTTVLRRARGFAPAPLPLPFSTPEPILACGGELKNTICLAKGSRAFLSPHIGDLEHYAAYRSFEEAIDHLERLFDARPVVVAHDLHPEYLSTKHAQSLADADPSLRLEPVQHHHAHAAACLAEAGHTGTAIAVCFDGLGYGEDGTLWGGEFLIAGLADYERVARLTPVSMPGGGAAIREPWRMAVAHIDAAFGDDLPPLDLCDRRRAQWNPIRQLARSGPNAPTTSSMGRLFDAVAALLGVHDVVSFEGQAAIGLEQCADRSETGLYPFAIAEGPLLELAGADAIRAVVEDLTRGTSRARIAARFHNGVAAAIVAICQRLRDRRDLATVALTGGVFQNAFLMERTTRALEDVGFDVLTHALVPPNDGGISFGQAVVAAARARRRETGEKPDSDCDGADGSRTLNRKANDAPRGAP